MLAIQHTGPLLAAPVHTYQSYRRGLGPFLIRQDHARRDEAHRLAAQKFHRQARRDPRLLYRALVECQEYRTPAAEWDVEGRRLPQRQYLLSPPAADGSLYSDQLERQFGTARVQAARAELQGIGSTIASADFDVLSRYVSRLLDQPVNVHTLWQYNHAQSSNAIWVYIYDLLPERPAGA